MLLYLKNVVYELKILSELIEDQKKTKELELLSIVTLPEWKEGEDRVIWKIPISHHLILRTPKTHY